MKICAQIANLNLLKLTASLGFVAKGYMFGPEISGLDMIETFNLDLESIDEWKM